MSFKNAFKNMIAHFGTVWAVLLYMAICSSLLAGLSLPFILPIERALAEAGVFSGIGKAFGELFGDGGWNGLWNGLYDVYEKAVGVFQNNDRVASLIRFFIVFVLIVAFRFFFGLYEIPLATVLDGRLSCNAAYGFAGKFISTLGTSVRFSLAKMPIMIAFDAASFGIIYAVIRAMGMNVMLPFIVITVMLVFRALRSSLTSCWAPCVAGGTGVIKGFARSCEIFFKRFGTVYSTYIIAWLLIISCVLFVSIFTLGAGLIVALPFSTVLLGYLGITLYYTKTGMRYYVDGNVFTPPADGKV